MIANYLKPPSGIYSQSQIASCFFVLPINWGALPTQMRRAIDFAVLREGTARIVGNTISLESMVNEINDYDPMEMRIRFPNNAGGHALVVDGYDIQTKLVHLIGCEGLSDDSTINYFMRNLFQQQT